MKIIKWLSLILLLIATTLWSVLAIYFGDSQTNTLQTSLAVAFGMFGLATLVSLGFPQQRKRFLLAYVISFIVILCVWCLAVQPSNKRQWQTDVNKLPFATIDGNIVKVYNIRNMDYRSETDYTPAYYDKSFDLTQLKNIDLFAVYWMGPAIAHTIISFNFGDKDHLAVSIEARKELNEGYSTIKGFFRQYELTYIVADERDVIRLRTNFRNNPPEQVYLYSIRPYQDNPKRLFLEYIRKINELHYNPAFYNTLLDNCTTSIWFNTRVNPVHLPFSWKILLSGYVPEYLYESKVLDTRIPFEQLQQRVHINSVAKTLDNSPDFAQAIRATLDKPD